MIQEVEKDDIRLNQFLLDNNIEKPINSPFSINVIYIEKRLIIGYLSYSIMYEKAEINNIYVSKDFRGQHIGSKLLQYLLEKCKTCENITLEVRKDNDNALKLYKKFGFKEVALREKYYNGIDGILMMREGEQMKDTYILAIESSCDETSVSIIKNGCEEIGTVVLSQMHTHANFGGVVPEIASRMHIENITLVIEECLNKCNMSMDNINAIAVTYGPGLIGSLLIGLQAAKTLSFIYNKPLIPVHHIAGHIYANSLVKPMEFPLIALVVSGGHTDLIYMKDHYCFEKIGGTLDDAVGEAYDKVARVLGLNYPGGPLVDKLAHEGKDTYDLPIPLNDDSYNFSFSGLKSAVINLSHNEIQRGNKIIVENLAASFQNRVVSILVQKTMKAMKEYNVNNLIVAGGVSANKGLREAISKVCEEQGYNLTIPEIKYCTDNAAMIGAAGYYAYRHGRIADLDLSAKASDILK